VAAGGPRYAWVQVDPPTENANGGEANGNIRNVILYNPARVSYVAGSVKLLDDVTPANGDSFFHSRHPLTADFMFHGEKVSFISVHNYARLGSDAMYGENQPPVISGDARRTDQTLAVRDYVQKLQAAHPDANIVVGGDFNGFQWETSLAQLEGAGGLANLVWKLPELDRYTSTFEGNNEQIDHLLVSTRLAAGAEFDNVHLNSNLTPDEVEAKLKSTARAFPAACSGCGTGIVDASAAVTAAGGTTTTLTQNEAEANNTMGTANAVATSGTVVNGNMGGSTDNDYFVVQVPAGRTLSAVLSMGSTSDYDLYVYSSSGSLLATSRNGAGSTDTVSSVNSTTATATRYVRVQYYSGGTGATNGKYTLKLGW